MSTDLVFAGRPLPYAESAAPDATMQYGRWKAQAESEVATFIEHHGGVITDDIEREISRRYGSIAGH